MANGVTEQRVPFLDLRVTDPAERAELLGAIEAVFDHGRLVLGPEVAEFESRVAAMLGRKWAIGVGSGTDALILTSRVLGWGPGDEVITTPLSWLATASSVALAGATPVFCDIDESLDMDPASIESLITPKTKAILIVHFTGMPCRMDELTAIADKHGIALIEDCAQAFGATYRGRPVGSFGKVACFSMNAMKVLASIGDAGVIVTDDDSLADDLRALRHSGVRNREFSSVVSHNCRLDTVQAAVLLKRLDRLPGMLRRRRALAARYCEGLRGIVDLPIAPAGSESAWYTFQIRTDRRDALREALESQAIETRIQHPILQNDQQSLAGRSRGESPAARRLLDKILCLPISEKLEPQQQERVIAAVRSFFGA